MADELNRINADYLMTSIKSQRPDLNEEQALQVVEAFIESNDANNGVCSETLLFWANSMFPKKDSYMVAIIETYQMWVTAEADSMAAAVSKVKQAYQNKEYVLDEQHFVEVNYIILENEPPDGGNEPII